jgi:uncharacterized phage protein (TIGR01671 family)
MNDRFRFRAWNVCDDELKGGMLYDVQNETDFDYFLESKKLVVEQCTGLKDKNGRLIYEGDIVCWTRAQTDGDVDSICPIVFDNDMCSFGPLLNGHSLWMPHQTDSRMKVLGNIHENPELLEDK